jgi:vacuolar-type H+-ATPase subunit F/Vma7
VPEDKIYVIGEEDIIVLMGLLGIEGTILNKPEEFLEEFNRLKQDSSIGMVIIAMDLLDEDIQILMEHKLSKLKPFIFYLPNIFKSELEEQTVFFKEINKSIRRIID